MKLDKIFPKKYLSAVDLKGGQYCLTIDKIEWQNMRTKITDQATGETKHEYVDKPVVYFVGRVSGVVLNKTRVGQLGQALGIDDTDQAHGRQIVVYADGNQIMFKAAPPKVQTAQADAPVAEASTDGQPPA